MSPPPPEPWHSQAERLPDTAALGETEHVSSTLAAADAGVSGVDLPDNQLPVSSESRTAAEDRWSPLPGAVGEDIETLARAALGDLLPPPPPEPTLDFNLLDDDAPPTATELAAGDAAAEEVFREGEEPDDREWEDASASPAEEAAPPKPCHLEIVCPTCSTRGLVPWERLDGVLCCSGCWTWFRVGGNGQLAVVDPPAASQGALRLYSRNGPDRTVRLKPELLEEKRQTARQRRRWGPAATRLVGSRVGPMIMALLPIAFLGAIIFLGLRWWSKPRIVKLPLELDQRAQVLAESWLKYDTQVMVRLTHRNYRGVTRRWAFDHKPPLSQGRFDRRKAAIDVRILRQDENTAEVQVHVDLSGLTRSPEPIVLRQHWECLEGTWFFKPAVELAVQPSKTAATPLIKK